MPRSDYCGYLNHRGEFKDCREIPKGIEACKPCPYYKIQDINPYTVLNDMWVEKGEA